MTPATGNEAAYFLEKDGGISSAFDIHQGQRSKVKDQGQISAVQWSIIGAQLCRV